MCNAHVLLDCALTIIEPTADYGFHEIEKFALKFASSVFFSFFLLVMGSTTMATPKVISSSTLIGPFKI